MMGALNILDEAENLKPNSMSDEEDKIEENHQEEKDEDGSELESRL